jgi:thiamine-phosphate pyrophosphorylase
MLRRYCITDSFDVAVRAAGQGAAMIQVRAKHMSARELYQLSRGIVAACPACPVLINSRLDIALAVGAAGVHLPSASPAPSDLRRIAPPGFLFGVSCHTVDELRRALGEGGDFAVFGPVFPTSSHPGAPGTGLDALRAACAAVALPVWALGGIGPANAQACIEAGAAGVAGITMFHA